VNEFLIFALGVVAGTAVAIGRDLFDYHFFRPKLAIGTDRPEIADLYTCHSLMIRNCGRRPACNVQGFISFDHIEPEDLIAEANLIFGRDLGFDRTNSAFRATKPCTSGAAPFARSRKSRFAGQR
jgi:hypothetical protein